MWTLHLHKLLQLVLLQLYRHIFEKIGSLWLTKNVFVFVYPSAVFLIHLIQWCFCPVRMSKHSKQCVKVYLVNQGLSARLLFCRTVFANHRVLYLPIKITIFNFVLVFVKLLYLEFVVQTINCQLINPGRLGSLVDLFIN